MKKVLSLLAGTVILFAACAKEDSDPAPVTPPVGDGTGKFTFSMDTANYRVDTLIVSYRMRDGTLKTQTLPGQNTWNSPDLVFKTGDSIRADVQALGVAKKSFPPPPAELSFEVYPSVVAVPAVKSSGSTNSTPLSGSQFKHSSSKYYTY